MGDVFRSRLASLEDSAESAGATSLQSALNEVEMQFALVAANVGNFVTKPDPLIAKNEARLNLVLTVGIAGLKSSNETLMEGSKEISRLLAAYHEVFLKFVEKSSKVDDLTARVGVAAAAIVKDAKVNKDDLKAQRSTFRSSRVKLRMTPSVL